MRKAHRASKKYPGHPVTITCAKKETKGAKGRCPCRHARVKLCLEEGCPRPSALRLCRPGDSPPFIEPLRFSSPVSPTGTGACATQAQHPTARWRKTMTTEPKIYVADLAAYNRGYLHCVWVDAAQDVSDIQEEIHKMLAESPVPDAEEYAIHDYEGFEGYALGEYEGIDTAHEIACFIEEHPEFGGALLNHFSSVDEARKAAEEDYCGTYESLADYAQELTEVSTQIPEHLSYYIDYERMAREMELNGDVFTIETGYKRVHIFWNR